MSHGQTVLYSQWYVINRNKVKLYSLETLDRKCVRLLLCDEICISYTTHKCGALSDVYLRLKVKVYSAIWQQAM